MSIHDDHRKRMRKRFLEEGLEHFTDVQVLELLLFYCIPRQDTNPLAHALIDHFGSLAQVLEAPAAELEKVKGIGPNAATFLSLMNQYTPLPHVVTWPELNHKVTSEEYEELVDYAIDLGVENGFVQEGETAEESFIPTFDFEGWK